MPQLKKGFLKFGDRGPPIRGDLDAQSGVKILQENPGGKSWRKILIGRVKPPSVAPLTLGVGGTTSPKSSFFCDLFWGSFSHKTTIHKKKNLENEFSGHGGYPHPNCAHLINILLKFEPLDRLGWWDMIKYFGTDLGSDFRVRKPGRFYPPSWAPLTLG